MWQIRTWPRGTEWSCTAGFYSLKIQTLSSTSEQRTLTHWLRREARLPSIRPLGSTTVQHQSTREWRTVSAAVPSNGLAINIHVNLSPARSFFLTTAPSSSRRLMRVLVICLIAMFKKKYCFVLTSKISRWHENQWSCAVLYQCQNKVTAPSMWFNSGTL